MDRYAFRPQLPRPVNEGRVDGEQLAAVAGQHIYLSGAPTLQEVCRTMEPTNDLREMVGGNYLQSVVQRENESAWRWEQHTDDRFVRWPMRAISEALCSDPDLRVMPDADKPERSDRAVLYRRALPDHMITDAPAQWVPIANLKTEYGGKGRDEDVAGIDSWLADAMLLAEQTITRGCSFINTDGEQIVRYDGDEEAWTLTVANLDGEGSVFAGAHSWECRRDGFKPLRKMERLRDAERADLTPTTYAIQTGVSSMEAKALSDEALDILYEFTSHYDACDSWYNMTRSLASMFLRSHPEAAYVYQGPGGSGKSTVAKDLVKHLDRQATTMSLDLLSQPTAMSTENAMGSLSSHLLALTDDYDPRNGRFEKIIAPLKTLLTGLLPYAARRRGEDSFEARPQAVHLITTNFHLPIDDSAAEQRRFAFATVADPERKTLRRYREFVAEHGFWPFMFASCQAWLTAGDMECQDTAYAELADLDDSSIELLRAAATEGYVKASAAGANASRCVWRNLGLKRSTKRIDGKVESVYRPYRREESRTLYSLWKTLSGAIMGEEGLTPLVAEQPRADLGLGMEEWAKALSEAGAAPRLFPCVAEGDKAKAPDADKLRRLTGTPSWQKAAANERLDLSRPCDDSPAQGMTVSPDMVWLDLDAHDKDGMSGWERANRAFGAYGTKGFPRSFAVATPSGGMHVLYRIPEGLKLKSRANADTQIDLRIGGKGYVVAGGSHTDKGDYTPVDTPADGKVPTLTDTMRAWLEANGYVEGVERKPLPEGLTNDQLLDRIGKRSAIRLGIAATDETPWTDFPIMGPGDTHDKLVSCAQTIANVASKYHRSQQWLDTAMEALRDRIGEDHMRREPQDWRNAVLSACRKAGVFPPASATDRA